MNTWAAPLAVIVVLIFAGILFFTQTQSKQSNALPDDAGQFKPISTPVQGQGQQQVQGQQTQAQQQQVAQQQAQQPPPQELKASYSATIKTSAGDIKVVLRSDKAPHTVINFINKAQTNFYNNLTFHRVEDWVVQGGDPQGTGAGGGQMATEINDLPFTVGALGVARKNDIRVSNDAQFFITKTDASWLNQQYTNFGQVTDGMDVVNKIKIGDKILGITVDGL